MRYSSCVVVADGAIVASEDLFASITIFEVFATRFLATISGNSVRFVMTSEAVVTVWALVAMATSLPSTEMTICPFFKHFEGIFTYLTYYRLPVVGVNVTVLLTCIFRFATWPKSASGASVEAFKVTGCRPASRLPPWVLCSRRAISQSIRWRWWFFVFVNKEHH